MIDLMVFTTQESFEQFLASLEMTAVNLTHTALDIPPHSLFPTKMNVDVKKERK